MRLLIPSILSIFLLVLHLNANSHNEPSDELDPNGNIGCVGNLIWLDTNADGVKNETEDGFGIIEIELRTKDKKLVERVKTTNGYFSICADAGSYDLAIVVPDSYRVTKQNAGDDEYHDSDSNSSGIVDVEITPGKKIGKFDIGLVSDSSTFDINSTYKNKPVTQQKSTDNKFNLGPWVEHRHRLPVFKKFNTALLWAPPEEIISILSDARLTNTRLFIQLGSAGDWGWNYEDNTSEFTLEKWLASAARFTNDKLIKNAISEAVKDNVIRGFYLIDEPHHKRWSPNQDNSNYITNSHIEQMAKFVKSHWPMARTSVRASPRTLASYNRDIPKWEYLDEAFIMINYNKWSKNGVLRTIDGFLGREIREAKKQNLGVIGSVQMLIGSPPESRWWRANDLGKPAPVGKLSVSPLELETYINHFTKPRNFLGLSDDNGSEYIDTVMIFRWDRNDETDWTNQHYEQMINKLIKRSNEK